MGAGQPRSGAEKAETVAEEHWRTVLFVPSLLLQASFALSVQLVRLPPLPRLPPLHVVSSIVCGESQPVAEPPAPKQGEAAALFFRLGCTDSTAGSPTRKQSAQLMQPQLEPRTKKSRLTEIVKQVHRVHMYCTSLVPESQAAPKSTLEWIGTLL